MPFRFERDGDRRGLYLVAPADSRVRAGRLTRSIDAQEIVPCAPSSSAAAASSPVEELARRGLRLLISPGLPAEALCVGGV